MNSSRMNRLEELGRVDAEKAYTKKGKRNLKDEKKRIVKGLKDGGSLKPVPADKKGLSKLPTKIRNKKVQRFQMTEAQKQASKTTGEKFMKYLKKSPLNIKGAIEGYAGLVLDRKKRLGKMGGGMMKRPMYNKGGRVGLKSGGLAKRGKGCEIK